MANPTDKSYKPPEAWGKLAQKEPTPEDRAFLNTELQFAFKILDNTNWWVGWRGSVLGLPILTYDPAMPTACVGFNETSGKVDFFFNANFLRHLTVGDICYVYAHEAMHVILDHVGRKKKYHTVWNVVTDAFINTYLDGNLKWGVGIKHRDRLDYILSNGIRWDSLPKRIQLEYPVENINQYSADEVYDSMIEHMLRIGEDPAQFDKEGAVSKVGEYEEDEEGGNLVNGSIKLVKKRVLAKVGDVVFVKSKRAYGRITSIDRNKEKEITTVKVEIDDSLTRKDLIPDVEDDRDVEDIVKDGPKVKPTDVTKPLSAEEAKLLARLNKFGRFDDLTAKQIENYDKLTPEQLKIAREALDHQKQKHANV